MQATKTSGGELVVEVSAQNIQNPVGSDGIVVNGDLDLTLTLSGGTNPSIRDHITITGGDFTVNSSINAWGIRSGGDFSVLRSGGVGGYLKGDIVFTGNLSSGSAFQIDESLEGTINIGQSLEETITIDGYSSSGEGLTGQIIVNSNNGSGVWETDATVTVDSTALSPIPYYNNKSDDIGGGAVGLAPFYCHYKDCSPRGTKVDEDTNTGYEQLEPCDEGYHAQLRVSPYATSSTVTIRHYGPVKQEGTGKPFEVWSKPINEDPCDGEDWNWGEVTGSFTHSFPSSDPRAIEITGPFADAHDYLIRPETSGAVMLVCDGLTTSNTVPVKDYDYRIRVFYLQNLNMAGGLEAGDIAAWLLDPADTTLDGTTDNNDLVDVINAVAEHGE
ncbi:hypothetical protein MNBD_PLANCTO03-1561 [hydrothermal vent metagenome]|uniref:Uncharacterized protein n=1 Tax=hydrothermal vent metagenome TaxID=652676 RepID=A0A3B1D2V3_9ZZZZ